MEPATQRNDEAPGMGLSARLTLATVALTLLTAAAVGWLTYRRLSAAILPTALARLEADAERLGSQLDAGLQQARLDVLAASGMPPVKRAVASLGREDQRPDGSPGRAWRSELAAWFLSELEAKPAYLQFRLIGIGGGGRELVRVDRSAAAGTVRVVPEPELQPKGGRDYFVQALALGPGELYVSPIELNREHGEIESPDTPVIRAATPLFDSLHRTVGILVINVDVRPLFARLAASAPPEHSLLVLDDAGRYLVHPDASRSFAFEREPNVPGWREDFPGLDWALSRGGSALVGARKDSEGEPSRLLCLASSSLRVAGGPRFSVVLTADRSVVLGSLTSVGRSALAAGSLAALLAILAAGLLARSMTRPLAQMGAAAEAIRRGEKATWPAADGGEIGVLASAFRKLVEDLQASAEALEEKNRRERLLSAVVESSQDAILTKQLDGTITSWNPAAKKLYGYSAQEVIGRHVSILVPDEAREELERVLASVRRGEVVPRFETVRCTKDGRRLDVSLSVSPVASASGRLVGASSVARDIADRKRAEALFHGAVEASPSGMLLVDRGGAIVLINRETERLFGYSREEIVGQPVEILVPEAARAKHPSLRAAFSAQPALRRMGVGRDLKAVRKDGSEFSVEVGLNPLESPQGPMVLAAVIDVSDRLEAQRLLERQAEELKRSNAELEEFAYIASHDLQEPLRMVASFTELLAERYGGRLDEKADKYIHYAVDGARRMQMLIRDLLAYSRVGTQGKSVRPTDAHAVLLRVVAQMKLSIEQSAAEITLEQLPTVPADEVQLERLFQNLLGNALKFRSADPPRVHVRADLEGESWAFSVADNGIGISPGEGERIFQMFQRVHERGRYEGSGIGLAIAKRIVERHGGRIWFESEPGKGTTFLFTLPAEESVA